MQIILETIAYSPFLWIAAGFGFILFLLNNIHPGLASTASPSKKPWLNAIVYFSVAFAPILLMLFLAVLAMLFLVGKQIIAGNTTASDPDSLRWYVLSFVGLLTALGGIIGTPLALIRVFNSERQTATQETGLSFDRYQRAVELLASDNGTIRIGAMHALAGLANDPVIDKNTVVGVLASHIRGLCSKRDLQEFDDPLPEIKDDFISRGNTDASHFDLLGRRSDTIKWVRSLRVNDDELQVAIFLLGNIPRDSKHRLNLGGCNFQGIKFVSVDFTGTSFSGSRFDGCIFENCCFDRSLFNGTGTNETHSSTSGSQLLVRNCCTFMGSVFIRVKASDASFNGAIFDASSFHETDIVRSNFSGCSFLGASLSGLKVSQSLFYNACLDPIWDSNPGLASENFFPNAITSDDSDFSTLALEGGHLQYKDVLNSWIEQTD